METIYQYGPYELERYKKRDIVFPKYKELTRLHEQNCREYRQILKMYGVTADSLWEMENIPMIPVRLFKEYSLKSVPQEKIVKTMLSSGTTGQASSQIFLDKDTALWQQKALAKIVGDFIGRRRMPMLVLDTDDVIKDRTQFSTRGAGILGFSAFGTRREFVLNRDMSINYEVLERFLKEHEGERILFFGFTFIIWKHFLLELERCGKRYDLSNAVMVHGGGWKKLKSEAVSKKEFRERFARTCGMRDIYENYGMAEQTGSIFMECELGHLHVSMFSDIFIRDPKTLKVCENGEKGILQVMSVLPHSYPGHSLLTEDVGVILGEDDCPCGRKGKYFEILGRLKNAELRGCSDTYAAGIKE
ncbi:MAG: acyl-protein synthetase [Lachnospiraceae bacterium]|jgi:phenylacetate-coenzyme A ligase PaaK-like adenylate-forming protein|nr:acyl-protein synthetase [Lachnospiraceae bacterium]